MKKILTIFKRNQFNPQELLPEPNPECLWVFAGEGIATRKYDGTCCLVKDGKLYRRREIKNALGTPYGLIYADYDRITGTLIAWAPVDAANAEDKWHIAAFKPGLPDGTYELLGPKIQGNPEALTEHTLFKHSDAEQFEAVPRTYEGLREWLADKNIEGLVFHHPDGRMAKIKKRDYGQKR